MKKKSRTRERYEALYQVKGKRNLQDIWDADRELDPKLVKELQNANTQAS